MSTACDLNDVRCCALGVITAIFDELWQEEFGEGKGYE